MFTDPQEERNCTGIFFMLQHIRLLSLNCPGDLDHERELKPEVSPCACAGPSLFPSRAALCLVTADDRGALTRATDFGAWGLSFLLWKPGRSSPSKRKSLGGERLVECEARLDLDDC